MVWILFCPILFFPLPSLFAEEIFTALARLEQFSTTVPEESLYALKTRELISLFLLRPFVPSQKFPDDPELALIHVLREHALSPTAPEPLGRAMEALPLDPRTRSLLYEYFTRGPLRNKEGDPLFRGNP